MSHVGCCDVCQRSASQRCGGCHEVFYCSKEHQKFGWKSHRLSCRPCKIAEDDTLGRHLVSTKSIKSDGIIFKELPLVYGPAQDTIPVCLGCGKAIHEKNYCPCSECGWPMCSEICQKNPSHLPECRYTVQRGDKVSVRNFGMIHPMYQCIVVLRCLYIKQFLPEIWSKLDKLQSHCDERKNTSKYNKERVQVAQFIRRFFKLDQIFTEDDIMRVCGIILVNSHEVPLSEPSHIAIYETCSFMEHSCRPNCSKSFASDGSIVIVAAENIPKDEHLSICYSDALWGTPNRRHYLYDTKFFWCSCNRCSDTTEFGTYFSAIRCQERNCEGYSLPKTFIEKTDSSRNSDWTCNKCNQNTPYLSVQEILERIGSDLVELPKGDVNAMKRFIEKCTPYLPPNHFYLTEIKLALVQAIGQNCDSNNLNCISDEELDLKAITAAQLLKLFDVLAPAERRLIGIMLFELHAAAAESARRAGTNYGEADVMYSRLLEAKRYLMEAIRHLGNEPSCLPEGQILKQAKQNLSSTELVLQKLQSSMNGPT